MTPRPPPGHRRSGGPWPKDPEIPEKRLRRALPEVAADGTVREAGIRSAVAGLHLDPKIHTAYETRDGVVGVSLSVRPWLGGATDCVLARVAPGRTDVWTPPRAQRMPGEAGCSTGNAISPARPPH
ncbi:MAG: hypothetical protein GEV11_06650 [Streptosporangiales bacterium]|nr:hypothetical protein [Streptosporangiales bacterium]